MSLRVDDLTVHYRTLRGDVKAVDGATFSIDDGEIHLKVGETTISPSDVISVRPGADV